MYILLDCTTFLTSLLSEKHTAHRVNSPDVTLTPGEN